MPLQRSRSVISRIETARSAASVPCATAHPSFAAPMRLSTGTMHVVEEDLVEVSGTPRLLDRSDLDARRPHVDDEATDPPVLDLGVGAREQHAPVGFLRPAGPDLLPVHDVVVAVAHRAGLEAGEIGPGVGLGVTLAPHFAVPNPGQVALALLGGPAVHQRRGHVEDPDVVQRVARDVRLGRAPRR